MNLHCNCELPTCEQQGHCAGACQNPPMVKVYYHIFGVAQNLCYACLSHNTDKLRAEDWTIQQRYARAA